METYSGINERFFDPNCISEIKTFLAYFLIFRIRFLPYFVCPSVRRPRYYFSWGYPIGAIYGSIDSLWLKDPISFVFHIKIKFYWYLRRSVSLMLGSPGVWFVSSDQFMPSNLIRTLWSIYTQWAVKIRLPVTPVTASFIFFTSCKIIFFELFLEK